jgi:hypothetical protein
MGAVWTSFGYVLVVSAVALLSTPFTFASLVRRRIRAGATRHRARRTAFLDIALVIGTVPPVWLILTPKDGPSRIVSPIDGIHADLNGGPVFATIQIVGNLLTFAVFGLLGPLRWRLGIRDVLLIAVAASTVLETLQYVLDLGRVTDLVDVVMNASGAGFAALCGHLWRLRGRTVEDCDTSEVGTATVGPHRYGERST